MKWLVIDTETGGPRPRPAPHLHPGHCRPGHPGGSTVRHRGPRARPSRARSSRSDRQRHRSKHTPRHRSASGRCRARNRRAHRTPLQPAPPSHHRRPQRRLRPRIPAPPVPTRAQTAQIPHQRVHGRPPLRLGRARRSTHRTTFHPRVAGLHRSRARPLPRTAQTLSAGRRPHHRPLPPCPRRPGQQAPVCLHSNAGLDCPGASPSRPAPERLLWAGRAEGAAAALQTLFGPSDETEAACAAARRIAMETAP